MQASSILGLKLPEENMKLLVLSILFLVISLVGGSNAMVFADASVVINEIMPHPASGNDWVELYNPGTTTVDLTNWALKAPML